MVLNLFTYPARVHKIEDLIKETESDEFVLKCLPKITHSHA